MYCQKCGYKNSDEAAFCNNCGSNLKNVTENVDTKNTSQNVEKSRKKITLGFVLGWLFGIMLFIAGIAFNVSGHLSAGIPLLLAACLLIPPMINTLEDQFKFRLTGGLRVLLVVVFVMMYAVNAPIDINNSEQDVNVPSGASFTSSSSSTPKSTETTTQTTYSKGDKVIVGDIAYTLNSAGTVTSVGNSYFSEEADGIFIIVDITIENIGDKSIDISSNYINVVDSQGRTFESDAAANMYLEDNLIFKQLQPGLPTSGKVVFDVPVGESFMLEVTDSLWGSNKKYITLGTT